MIGFTARAARQVDNLQRHYDSVNRPEAARNFEAALKDAALHICDSPAAGLPAPRPYPMLARPGQAWIKAGPYWIRYRNTSPPVITGVFHDRADIPGRA